MTGDALKKVRPGDRMTIQAETFNTFIDAARAHLAGRQKIGGRAVPTFRDTDIVSIRNDSNAARSRFDVLGINEVITLPTDDLDAFKSQPYVVGVTPLVPDHVGKFAILLEPVELSGVARAAIGGLCVANVYAATGEDWYPYADIADNDPVKLRSAPHGAAQVLWREAGAGTNWGVVRLGTPQGETTYWGKLVGALYAGATAEVDLYWGAGINQANHRITVFAPPLLTSGFVRSGSWVEVTYRPDAQRWYVTNSECN